jgi:hypothetical protein
MRTSIVTVFLTHWPLLLCFLGSGLIQEHAQQPTIEKLQSAPEIEIQNVLFRYSPELAVLIVRLRGTIIPSGGHPVATFNDPTSFSIGVQAAEIRVSAKQLAALMNTRVTRSPKAQVKDLRIAVSGEQLVIDGTMKKGLHVPFHAVADVGLTDDNRIRINIHQVKVISVPMKGLLDALGLSMEGLISQKGLKGMSVDGDSFLIDPQTVFPAPQIQGRITGARVADDGIVVKFGGGAPQMKTGEKGNYIALRGGEIEYGRDEMFDSDLTLTDSTPNDPLEFYLGQYWRQMVAGSIKVTPTKALRVRIPDYSKIENSARTQASTR